MNDLFLELDKVLEIIDEEHKQESQRLFDAAFGSDEEDADVHEDLDERDNKELAENSTAFCWQE
ncbi:uncharacterized protein EKO05_0006406 [Ascochyta rabiei]|uniref:uncharacterized protein n=1 Tax=Didymella rabiei TaxID=5454 RepID=UPI00220B2BFC|nr:uncharacterized protein EKO05_0006406 [Ascochyta rabiei]UPX15977.1 hypothetical protein EKO05_0006406 [Ascochyta rabiei]